MVGNLVSTDICTLAGGTWNLLVYSQTCNTILSVSLSETLIFGDILNPQVVEDMTAEQKKVLLFFWTSIKYLPVEGFSGLSSRLYIYKTSESSDRLPSSHTCFYRLCLPAYPTSAVMHGRLSIITQEHVGCSFGTW